jgi:hypothetical protein
MGRSDGEVVKQLRRKKKTESNEGERSGGKKRR